MSTTGNLPVRQNAHPLSTKVAVEALGSFVIVFAALFAAAFSNVPSSLAMATGLGYLVVIVAFGNISQGYFNPMFSLAMAVGGRLKWAAAILFIVAQTVGAIAAALVLFAVVKSFPADAGVGVAKIFSSLGNGFGAHSPLQVPLAGVLIVEIVVAAVLAAVVLGATSRNNNSLLAPVAIGLAIFVAMIVSTPISNGSLNPARSTSVAFLSEPWALEQLWLFWLAPLFGAALTAAIYRTFTPTELPVAEDPTVWNPAVENPAVANDDDASVITQTAAVNAQDKTAGAPTLVATDSSKADGVVAGTSGSNDAQDFFDKPAK